MAEAAVIGATDPVTGQAIVAFVTPRGGYTPNEGLTAELKEHVVRSITSGTQQLVDGLEGRKSLELISAIYESVETGREIPLRFAPKRCRLGEKPA